MSRLGRLIQSYLAAHPEMTKREFAARAGVTPQSISGWLSGKTEMKEYPAKEHMQGLADAMGLHFCDVLDTVTLDLGHEVVREPIEPDVAVTISSLSKMSPVRRRAVAQMVATMAAED